MAGEETTFPAPQSRNEAILQNMLGADNELPEPMSRIEVLLIAVLEKLEALEAKIDADTTEEVGG